MLRHVPYLVVLGGSCAPAFLLGLGEVKIEVWIIASSTLLGIATLLIQQYYTNKTAVRNHEWDMAERQASREAEAKAQADRADLYDKVTSVERATDKHASEMKGLINENTDISRSAFREANSVNEKIASIGEKLAEQKPETRNDG